MCGEPFCLKAWIPLDIHGQWTRFFRMFNQQKHCKQIILRVTYIWFRWCDLEHFQLRTFNEILLFESFCWNELRLQNGGAKWMYFACRINMNFGEQRIDYSPNPCPTTQFAVVHNGNWLIERQRKIPQRDFLSLCIFCYSTPYTLFWQYYSPFLIHSQTGNYSKPKI